MTMRFNQCLFMEKVGRVQPYIVDVRGHKFNRSRVQHKFGTHHQFFVVLCQKCELCLSVLTASQINELLT